MVDDQFLSHGLDHRAFPLHAVLVSALFSSVLFGAIVVAVIATIV